MRTLSRLLLASLLFLPFLCTGAHAQTKPPRPEREDPDRSHFFVGIDLGVGVGSLGLAGLGDLFVRYDEHIVDLRLSSTAFISDQMQDAGLLYGRQLEVADDILVLNAMAGLGLAASGSFASSESRIALPLEVQFIWVPFPWLGLGLCGFADINSIQTFGGVTLSMQVGLLR